jgi:hypothetical protein
MMIHPVWQGLNTFAYGYERPIFQPVVESNETLFDKEGI